MKATLKQWRGLRGMTQEELAEAMDVSPITISSWETGKAKPRSCRHEKLREVLMLNKADQIILP